MKPAYFTFWSINGPLDQRRLREQMDAFQAAGLHGVVFHPRYYPGIPPYMSAPYLKEVSDSILYAKEIGLRYWLYDENGWPSGTADGQLLARYPESAAVRLDLMETADPASLGSFTDAGKTWHMVPRVVEGIDTLNPDVCRHFLELIHERYRTGLAPEAFDYVEAFFADEPESGAIKGPMPAVAGAPWSPRMAEALRQRYGDGYAQKLPLIFTRGQGYREFRIAYWELMTDLIGEGFFAPYLAWCRRYGKQFVGHVKGEEHPLFQLPMVGSCHRIYRQLSMPGIDSLERYPAIDFYPRQASSVARQFGDGRCMVECFGGAGWGAAPEDLERYLLWLGRNGLTDFVFHLSQYRLDSAAIRDWPPSEPLHLTWRETFPAVLERVTRALVAEGEAPRPVLVVAPYRGLMAEYEPWELMQTNAHVATTYPDTPAGRINRAFLAKLESLRAAGIGYDVTDERTFEEEGRIEGGRVRLGQAVYEEVIAADGAKISDAFLPRTPQREASRSSSAFSASSALKDRMESPATPVAWQIREIPLNSWLLEFKPDGPGAFRGEFDVAFGPGEAGPLVLRVADDLATASLDGGALAFQDTGDGVLAALPASLAPGRHVLKLRCVRETRHPYVWLEGRFLVRSATSYSPGPNRTVRTAGPFSAHAGSLASGGELAAAGLPFLHHPLVAEAMLNLPASATTIRFIGAEADAIHVSLDGRPIGWAWGPDWSVALPPPAPGGGNGEPSRTIPDGERSRTIPDGERSRTIGLSLIPSTFNRFGPHHYYNGDWHVVSPDQMVGTKNFADLDDAPVPTHVAAWHFKPLRLPTKCVFE